MHDVKQILVPVDFSSCSKEALDYALSLAGHFKARVDVFHAWSAPSYVSPYLAVRINTDAEGENTLENLARTEATKQMLDFVAAADVPEGVQVNLRVEFGIESDIIKVAAQDYDLIVMGTHGRTGLPHFFMGSVTEKVVRSAPTPVIIVRAKEQEK